MNGKSNQPWLNGLLISKKRNVHLSWFFDIESFYPSITERLFINAIQFVKQITKISDYGMSLINQSGRTLLFYEKTLWVKKAGSKDFDVPMGCFDGAEVCELVGIFIFNKLKSAF